MLFIKSVLKFKYEPGRLKVNAIYGNKFIHKAICGQNAGVWMLQQVAPMVTTGR